MRTGKAKNGNFTPCKETEVQVVDLAEFSQITNVRGSTNDKAPLESAPVSVRTRAQSKTAQTEAPSDIAARSVEETSTPTTDEAEAGRGWLNTWMKKLRLECPTAPSSWAPICIARNCSEYAAVGGHVWLLDPVTRRYPKDYCYIVPLCSTHNSTRNDKKYGYPFCFQVGSCSVKGRCPGNTTGALKVLRIRPHALFEDYTHDFIVTSFPDTPLP